jgi:uncharacterized membrane protein
MIMLWDRVWWTRFVVGPSIALNIFFASFLLVQTWNSQQAEIAPGTPTANDVDARMPAREVLRQLTRKLLPDDARLLREAFRAKLPQLLDLQREARLAADKVRRDVDQSTLDMDKLRADLAAARQAREKVRPVMEEVLLEVLPRMSEPGRHILSQYRLMPGR